MCQEIINPQAIVVGLGLGGAVFWTGLLLWKQNIGKKKSDYTPSPISDQEPFTTH